MRIDGYTGEYLSEEEILHIHYKLAEASEDTEDIGFIDNTGSLFKGAVNSIFASFFGEDAYPTIEEKACRLCFNIVSSHCFKNVNKRTGLMAMIMTYQTNGIEVTLNEDELFEALTSITNSESDENWETFKSKIVNNLSKKNKIF